MIIISGLFSCSRNVEVLNGHYVAVNDLISDGYATIDIHDSLVLLNHSSVFFDDRDTIIIDPTDNSFIRSNRIPFPIYEFEASNDTIFVSYAYDAGEETIKFIKKKVSPMFNFFAESSIDIQLIPYNNEDLSEVELSKPINLIIGRLKENIDWPEVDPDSIIIEFEGFDYLDINDLPELNAHLQQTNSTVLCLHFDKRVPTQVATEIRNKLDNAFKTYDVVESRFNGTDLVFIK